MPNAKWTPFNAKKFFPAGLNAALHALGEAGKVVAEGSKGIGDALGFLNKYLVGPTNIARAALRAAIQAVRQIWGDTMAIGIYSYYDLSALNFFKTRSFDAKKFREQLLAADSKTDEKGRAVAQQAPGFSPYFSFGASGWVQRWKASFADLGDLNRPAFSNTASVSALVFIAGMPSLPDMANLLKLLGELFGIGEFLHLLDFLKTTKLAAAAHAGDKEIVVVDSDGFREDYFAIVGANPTTADYVTPRRIDRATDTFQLYEPVTGDWPLGTPVTMCGSDPQTTAASQKPDWLGGADLMKILHRDPKDGVPPMKLGDLPPMKKMDRLVRKALGLMDLGPEFMDAFARAIKLVTQKLTKLQRIADEFDNDIKLIETILRVSGVNVIYLTSATGPQGLFDALDAAGLPELPPGSFIAGACLASGAPDFATVAKMFTGQG